MIVNVIEIFTEYLSIILCLHKIAGKKMKFDRYIIMFFLMNFLCVFIVNKYQQECRYLLFILYLNFVVYTKLRICQKWKDAIKTFGIMFIVVPSMQLVMFFCVKLVFIVFNIALNGNRIGIVANCINCVLIVFGKKQYIFTFANGLWKIKEILISVVFCLFFDYLLYFYKQSDYIHKPITLQAVIAIIGVTIIVVLWINAENEKKIKVKELQLYEIYNKTFEDAIVAIRLRQHEFDNHINAIKCMQYSIESHNELVQKQNEYCDMVLNENSFNNLLKLHTEPILTGFLYSKFMNAKEQGIRVIHEVHAIKLHKRVDISALLEILGVFIDNAVDALLAKANIERILIVKIIQEDKERVSIEVANRSHKYLNCEIEKFCQYGYSTKGENRGVGLSRVKEIVKKYKADFLIANVNYNKANYLSFKIIFRE